MKTKKFEKKLELKKKTIANLNNQEMVTVNGGVEKSKYFPCPITTYHGTCETCETCTCGESYCSTPCC